MAIKAVTADGEDEGTGIVLNNKGLILTNDHVVKGATSLTDRRQRLLEDRPAARSSSAKKPTRTWRSSASIRPVSA